ncbi:MAG: tol-pal system protein YbgF [Bacteroidota bacterium]|nr:tol-pal system protein YbgF [Bacteroidota bacterium]
MFIKKSVFITLIIILNTLGAHSQNKDVPRLLADMNVQIEATQAVNDLYNFKFERAERQFRWLKQKYKWHPLPYFLLGLSEWWKIVPNMENTAYDAKFLAYMDTSIFLAERLYELDETNIEATFFLSAAYGFKGRLYSDRKIWGKATSAGKNSLKYLDKSKGQDDLSPEFLFGNALYNYYSVWVPENYPLLRPVLMFFAKGDKNLGIKQLKEVANNAFYTRTEAQNFLMRILAVEENDPLSALPVSEYLAATFPDNAYFHRFYARLLYSSGQQRQTEKVSLDILDKIEKGMVGYEATSGRYASFYLGQIYETRGDLANSKKYYEKAIGYGDELEAYESGYYLYSLLALAKIADKEKNKTAAKDYINQIKKHAKRKHPAHKAARDFMKSRKN